MLPRESTPKHLLQSGNLAQHIVVSSDRIRAELGYREPVPIGEAVRRTIVWEQRNPPAAFNPDQFDYDSENEALASLP
jgi:nucleoside-diphosphate-sugar epimerase